MITEAIILAGGKGTRLQSVVKDVPKPMAEVRGRPFLEFLLLRLKAAGIERVILSVGYKWEVIREHFGVRWKGLELVYCVEESPLGTGGGIRLAASMAQSPEYIVLNGDSLIDIDFQAFHQAHQNKKALLSIALKPMLDFDRYGTVETNGEDRVTAFREKQAMQEGQINAGIYLIHQDLWQTLDLPEKFSFETDLMERFLEEIPIFGFSFSDYFIDIGIPEDYARAQEDFARFEN